MEQNQSISLFGLSIDPNSKAHLTEAARWARFLAIVGFVMCALIVVAGIFFGSFFSILTRSSRYNTGFESGMASGIGTMMLVIYIIMAAIMFFPYLFLFRFANHMKSALASNDQNTLNTSFQNLKIMFRYLGIITIILLSFYAIVLLIALIGVGASGF